MVSQQPTLTYGPPLPLHRQKRVRRWTLLLALAAVLASSWWWGPPAWHRAQALRAQGRCMTFAAPQGQVVYESDPAADPFARSEANAVTQPSPACWSAVQRTVPPPRSWSAGDESFEGLNSAFNPFATAPAYLHERSAGRGRRLVVAQLGSQLLGGKSHRVICCRVFEPATWRRDPALL